MIIYEELMGLPSDAILSYLIGLEFIHVYSLVHDDLPSMDNDEFRRGRLTVWKKYDEATAILVGDALQSMGIECLAGAQNIDVILEITKAIGDMGMVRGQISDINCDQMKMDQKDIIRLHDEKTGKLMTAPFVV
jgi:geranylgeranyl pyrophosphate synthase